jgi:hypothetical protein
VRRFLAVTSAALLAAAAAATAAPTAPVAVPLALVPSWGTAVVSQNVTHLGMLPLEGVGVSMRVVQVDGQRRAFVSGAAGLSIYDATDPRHPGLLGHLPLYNWENEDIAVSRDGRTAILTEFTSTLYLHVVDVSDPTLPRIMGTLVGGAHTVECADVRCHYLFGAEGQTYDIRDRSHPVQLPRERSWGHQTGTYGNGHALHQDAAGIWTADTSPLVVFEARNPLRIKVLTRGTITRKTAYQHNNIRPRADRYVPRPRGSSSRGPLRDGELLLGEGETNFDASCHSGSGAFSTWSMVGFDRHAPMRQLDVLRPVTGSVGQADPAVTAMGCSGHWFSVRDAEDGSILVAAAWYEHGTRFLKVDPRTGRIRQVGFFQPMRGATSAAYWMDDRTVWTVDYHSGVDVLTFDQDPFLLPTRSQLDASWLLVDHVDPFAEALRRLCRAGAEATSADHERLHLLVG